jgi:transposase-like protein
MENHCPRCQSTHRIKSGIIDNRQRYKCKECGYFYTVAKLGKRIPQYYVTKALQLYLEGLSYREIERLLGISHVTILNWVKIHRIQRLERVEEHPSHAVVTHAELLQLLRSPQTFPGGGMMISRLNDRFMVIEWGRLKQQ